MPREKMNRYIKFGSVKGFLATGKIQFICRQPRMGNHATCRDLKCKGQFAVFDLMNMMREY